MRKAHARRGPTPGRVPAPCTAPRQSVQQGASETLCCPGGPRHPPTPSRPSPMRGLLEGPGQQPPRSLSGPWSLGLGCPEASVLRETARGHPAYPWGQTTLAAGSGDLLEVAPPPLQGPASHSSPGKTWRPLSWALCFRCSGHQETDAQTQRRVGRDGQTPFREPRWQRTGALPQPRTRLTCPGGHSDALIFLQ